MSGPNERATCSRVVALHGAGLLVGALASGLVLTLVGTAVRAAGGAAGLRILLWIALALAAAQCVTLALPQSRWQVPGYWRRHFDPRTLALAYGAILGTGFFTAVVVGSFWIFAAATMLVSPPAAIAGWVVYALARTTGFALALTFPDVEALLLSGRQRWIVLVLTTGLAGLLPGPILL